MLDCVLCVHTHVTVASMLPAQAATLGGSGLDCCAKGPQGIMLHFVTYHFQQQQQQWSTAVQQYCYPLVALVITGCWDV